MGRGISLSKGGRCIPQVIKSVRETVPTNIGMIVVMKKFESSGLLNNPSKITVMETVANMPPTKIRKSAPSDKRLLAVERFASRRYVPTKVPRRIGFVSSFSCVEKIV